jgi:phage tail-like protein
MDSSWGRIFFCLVIIFFVSWSTLAQEDRQGGFLLRSSYGEMGWFASCSGLGSENEVMETVVEDGLGRKVVVKSPGALRYLDVSCTGGMSESEELFNWRALVVAGREEEARRDILLVPMDPGSNVVWELQNAWPRKLVISPEDCRSILELILVHEGARRIQRPPGKEP